jgi:hypothetical protein
MGELLGRIIFSVFELLFQRLFEIIFGAIKKAVVGWESTIITAFRESASRGLLCLFVPPYAISYATELKRQRTEVEWVITEFMEAGAARNLEAVYACWSPQSVTKEEIAGVIERSDKVFAGYERLSIDSLGKRSVAGVPDVADVTNITDVTEGTGVTEGDVGGAIVYTGGKKLPLKAQLVKENDVWKIISMQIGSTKMMDIVKRLSISLGGPLGPV